MITTVDSQFINFFYGTNLGIPGKLHSGLFFSFVILATIINTMLLLFVKKLDIQAKIYRPLLFRLIYIAASAVQYAISIMLFIMIFEMLIYQEYNKTYLLLVTYFSHIWSAFTLGILSLTFIQWFRYTRSYSLLIYGVVFTVIIFLILITIPLFTDQFRSQTQAKFILEHTRL